MRRARAALICAAALAAQPLLAETALELPVGSVETYRAVEDPGEYRLPVARYSVDAQPRMPLEGRVFIRAWRLPVERSDTLSVVRAVRPQLLDAGFEILFECETEGCGGFDFRFNARVLPPPQMEMDLGDFRFIAARRVGEEEEHLGLLVSRTPRGGYVQLIEVAPALAEAGALAPPPAPDEPESTSGLAAALDRDGRAVLEGVVFASGARTLDDEAAAALEPLAELMRARPGLALVVVGHSDNTGSLASNIQVSRQRAEAVRDVLIGRYAIARDRLGAEGAGFLAPLAPNTTEEGRAKNRRVEVILK